MKSIFDWQAVPYEEIWIFPSNRPYRHSGLDPWFDVPYERPSDRLTVLSNVEGLTTLSMVEGESSVFQVLDAGSGPA